MSDRFEIAHGAAHSAKAAATAASGGRPSLISKRQHGASTRHIAWCNLATRSWKTGSSHRGENALREAAGLDPDEPAAWGTLGWCPWQEDKATEARADLEQAIGLDPESPELHNSLVNILWGTGDQAATEQHFWRGPAHPARHRRVASEPGSCTRHSQRDSRSAFSVRTGGSIKTGLHRSAAGLWPPARGSKPVCRSHSRVRDCGALAIRSLACPLRAGHDSGKKRATPRPRASS